jgi:DnaA-like protein
VWYTGAMIRHNEDDRLTMNPCTPRPSAGPNVTPQLKRAIAARWKRWEPWVRMEQLRAPAYDPSVASAESDRLRHCHSDHILAMLRVGISMRTIRRHRLDDPRIKDEVWAVLVQAARERQSKAWYRRSEEQRKQDRLATLIKLGYVANLAATKGPESESHEGGSHPARVVLDPLALQEAIQAIRRQVCELFNLREMRDPDLKVRTNRRSYVLPRQIAMYVARQLMGASLQEIGREFGGKHHTTVLHSINKIEAMRRTDEALNRTISRLIDTFRLCVPCACV